MRNADDGHVSSRQTDLDDDYVLPHHGLWIIVHYQVTFGHIMPTIVTAQAQRLKTTDPCIVQRYTDILSQYIQDHNLLERAYSVQCKCTYPLQPHLQVEMKSIDSLRHQGMLLADRKCRKLPTGAIAWSPTVQKARDLVEIWGLLLKKKAGRRISSRLLSRGMARHHLMFRVQDITLTQIVDKKKEALKEYRLLKKSSLALRQTHLEELAEARAAVGNNPKATELRQLHTREHQRALARRIHHLYGTLQGGVTSVIAPNMHGDLVEMTAKSDMETAIMIENESKYRQASQTPFMQNPLLQDFGYLGIGHHADSVMQGTYQTPLGVDPYSAMFIKQLQMEPAIANS
jgi:hypothetical protein